MHMHLVLLLKGQVRDSHMSLKDPSGKYQILFLLSTAGFHFSSIDSKLCCMYEYWNPF